MATFIRRETRDEFIALMIGAPAITIGRSASMRLVHDDELRAGAKELVAAFI